jgi:hypothetical protein
MKLRRRKSRKAQAVDLLGSYLKLKAVSEAAKSARKVAKRKPIVRGIPLVAVGVGVAAFFATKALRGGHQEQPA